MRYSFYRQGLGIHVSFWSVNTYVVVESGYWAKTLIVHPAFQIATQNRISAKHALLS